MTDRGGARRAGPPGASVDLLFADMQVSRKRLRDEEDRRLNAAPDAAPPPRAGRSDPRAHSTSNPPSSPSISSSSSAAETRRVAAKVDEFGRELTDGRRARAAVEAAGAQADSRDAEPEDEMAAMAAALGLPVDFGSSKGGHVDGNDAGAASYRNARKYRQYMNLKRHQGQGAATPRKPG